MFKPGDMVVVVNEHLPGSPPFPFKIFPFKKGRILEVISMRHGDVRVETTEKRWWSASRFELLEDHPFPKVDYASDELWDFPL